MSSNREDKEKINQKTNKDINKSEKDLHPHSGKPSERFPESSLSKNPRKDEERVGRKRGDDSATDDLAEDVKGSVGSRATGSDPEDNAGVADIDRANSRD